MATLFLPGFGLFLDPWLCCGFDFTSKGAPAGRIWDRNPGSPWVFLPRPTSLDGLESYKGVLLDRHACLGAERCC